MKWQPFIDAVRGLMQLGTGFLVFSAVLLLGYGLFMAFATRNRPGFPWGCLLAVLVGLFISNQFFNFTWATIAVRTSLFFLIACTPLFIYRLIIVPIKRRFRPHV